MSITDPKPLIDAIDLNRLKQLLGTTPATPVSEVPYMHPGFSSQPRKPPAATTQPTQPLTPAAPTQIHTPSSSTATAAHAPPEETAPSNPSVPTTKTTTTTATVLTGKIQTLGSFIDTDALAPAAAIAQPNITPAELGTYCLVHTHPQFRALVASGHDVVVAGRAFGVGSSRENAVTALQGAGVRCVIARSFAFIYGRNQPNLGLLGFVIQDEGFYEVAVDGKGIEVDVGARVVRVEGCGVEWGFELSAIEEQLWRVGGMGRAFRRWGKAVLEVMTEGTGVGGEEGMMEEDVAARELKW